MQASYMFLFNSWRAKPTENQVQQQDPSQLYLAFCSHISDLQTELRLIP